NPIGYMETEAIKKIPRESADLLLHAQGKAIKTSGRRIFASAGNAHYFAGRRHSNPSRFCNFGNWVCLAHTALFSVTT
ncbi:MAG: hypothetical protein AAFO84_07850, partial [Cyanobacteria bacterium J06598_1]